MNKNTSGFTIVELLIVIVVIAILAAISIVAYNGIQNRTHDTAVQADLIQFSKLVSLYHAEQGVYPVTLEQVRTHGPVRISKESYTTTFGVNDAAYNVLYCFSNTTGAFGIVARSRSGAYFQYRDGSVSPYVGVATAGVVTMCPDIGVTPYQNRIWLYFEGAWQV